MSAQFLNGTSTQNRLLDRYTDKITKKDDICKLDVHQVQFVVEMGVSVTQP